MSGLGIGFPMNEELEEASLSTIHPDAIEQPRAVFDYAPCGPKEEEGSSCR